MNYSYKKKPVIVEAFQMTKERRLDNGEWPNWLHRAWNMDIDEKGSLFTANDGCLDTETHKPLFIQTLEGTQKVSWNDYIIQGVHGEIYPCKPDIFDATYERVED